MVVGWLVAAAKLDLPFFALLDFWILSPLAYYSSYWTFNIVA